MRKSLFLILLLLGCSVAAQSQTTRSQAREAEWKSYVLPRSNFTRQLSARKEILFRVPADWKQEGSELVFYGPHSARIFVQIADVPDGYPFQQFFTSVLKAVTEEPGAAELTIVRKTQLQDLEAREISLDLPNEEGEMFRRVLWSTVVGPLALAIHFQVPTAHAAETEPYYKATVQSLIFLSPEDQNFETVRASVIKTPAPGPIHELESIVASLSEVNPNREAAVTRLAALFSSHTDVAVDLLVDRRPFIRAAAVQAAARTNNAALTPFLWTMVDDEELLVAEVAARAVASSPDVVARALQHSYDGARTEVLARLLPFMAKAKRNELLQDVFSKSPVQPKTPVVKRPAKQQATAAGKAPQGLIANVVGVDASRNKQMGALSLLINVPAQEFKLPLARILASKNDDLLAVALEVAYYRSEPLPADEIFKLLSSPNQRIKQLAAKNLPLAALTADIPRIEALIPKTSTSTTKAFEDELKASIKKIRFRYELSGAKTPAESREMIKRVLSDSSLAEFAWRFDCEGSGPGCTPAVSGVRNDFTIKPFAENLFPERVKHYTAIPNPAQAVQKFYESLNGLQLDSPRAQANLVLMMGTLRQHLMRGVDAPIDAETLIEFSGIDPSSPIVMTAWTAEGALDRTSGAERKAIVVRVKDRIRFERVVEEFQDNFTAVTELTTYVAIGTRAIAALPAALPFGVLAAQSLDEPKRSLPTVKYAFSRNSEWNGLRIRTLEHHRVNSDGTLNAAVTHVAFVGDVAIITSDIATLRELLTKTQTDRHLANNEAYRKAVKLGGDIVYFSDLEAVMAEAAATSKNADDFKAIESGALNFAGASWENNHHLSFKESDWANSFLPFNPKELSAPRELLPASTIAYYLMKLDMAKLWPSRLRTSFLDEDLPAFNKVWSIDFEKEILPELGPECGVALLELPDKEFEDGSWTAFCQLKTNKLADALTTGKLFTGVGPAKEFVEIKVQETSYFVSARAGFLVVSNNAKAIGLFDGKTNLVSTRDYSRAVEKASNGIVAFGGYNLEAAIKAANKTPLEGEQAEFAQALSSVASAFHSQSFFATASAGSLEARSSVAMDREGRYPVADFSMIPRGTNITFVTLEPKGVPITDQKRISNLVVRIKAKAPGPIDNIRDDLKTAEQTVEQKSAKELLVTVPARRSVVEKAVQLPVADPQFTEHLKSTAEIAANDANVKEQARQIAGEDRDAWSVARKLAEWTYKNLEWKLVAEASAGDTLATREADCSEFSQLYVAMARSLGLPARMVSGLAYSGDSFGGHAWVEVWVGKWVELDPTWGTEFVDATHIRNNSNTLTTSAALNLIELEVVEANRTVAEFQKTSRGLGVHLLQTIAQGNRSDLEAAIDLTVLTDDFLGEGAWSKMNDAEREQMWLAYRRLLSETATAYSGDSAYHKLRLLHHEERDNVANVTTLLGPSDIFLKLRLVRRNDAWYLVEIVQQDLAFRTFHETLQPTIAAIEKTRRGQKPDPATILTDYARTIVLLKKDAGKAAAMAETALKANPNDQGLRYLKAIALLNAEQTDEAVKLLRELSDDSFPVAVYKLAAVLSESQEESKNKESVELFERYTRLEPHDSRGFNDLATMYDYVDNLDGAEAALRKVIELNPNEGFGYRELMIFLAQHDKLTDVRPVLLASDKNKDVEEDILGAVLYDLYAAEEHQIAQQLAMSELERLNKSAMGNLALGRIFLDAGKYTDALNALNLSARLDATDTGPHLFISQVHRKQSKWKEALKAAQHAVSLDAQESEAHYQLACTLARMGRLKEAIAALEKSIELDPDQAEYAAVEADLKPLASLPAFKKLLPEPTPKP